MKTTGRNGTKWRRLLPTEGNENLWSQPSAPHRREEDRVMSCEAVC